MNLEITRDLGRAVAVGVGAGYVRTAFDFLPTAPLTSSVIDANVVDVTAFLTSRHFELHGFYSTYRGQNSLDAGYIGQSLLPSEYNLNVLDFEAQFTDTEHLKYVDNSLHIGLGYRYKAAVWGYLSDGETRENWESAYIHDEFGFGKGLGARRQFAIVGDFRGDYVPYLNKFVPSPKGSVLFHPTNGSTIRALVATAFRIPTFLESYVDVPIQLPVSGAALRSSATNSTIGTPRLKEEQVITEELGYLNQDSDYFTFDSAFFHNNVSRLIDLAPNRAITVSDLGNPASTFNAPTATYPLFWGGFENQCQTQDVYGAELGVRVYPVEGLDIYANYTFMSVKPDTSGCSPAQLANYVPDARTSAHKVNAGIQVRSNLGLDASVDFNYVSAQDWALQISDVQAQQIKYESFHLDPYEVVNGRIGYRFNKNKADLGVTGSNLLNNQHREYPFGQTIGQRVMGMFSYRF
jgi:iron complex outermembrane receptor protein